MTAADDQTHEGTPSIAPSLLTRLEDEDDAGRRDSLQREFSTVKHAIERQVPDQAGLVEDLLIALLAEGHLLLAGTAGLTETAAMEALAAALRTGFRRIQMTPDLEVADWAAHDEQPQEGADPPAASARFWGDIVLIEDFDRAPAQVQSAFGEALDGQRLFSRREAAAAAMPALLLASLTPLEEATGAHLSRSQRDRFLMQLATPAPSHSAELAALRRHRRAAQDEEAEPTEPSLALDEPQLSRARRRVLDLHLAPAVEDYLVGLVQATRAPERQQRTLAGWLRDAPGFRATLALERCARAHAWLAGRDYVSPDDVHAVAPGVLRHRLLLSDAARAAGRTPDDLVAALLGCLPVV